MGKSIDDATVDTVSGLQVRAIAEDEVEAWCHALVQGFLRPHAGGQADIRRPDFKPGRWTAGFDGDRMVATFRSFDVELTVPGGSTVTADAITNVSVLSTHRRRGLLGTMMRRDLAAAAERGTEVAILIAAEYGIYGRYGFGPATRGHGWNIDLNRVGGLRDGLPTVPGGRIDFVSMDELREIGPKLYDRWRVGQPGAITRSESWWKHATGVVRYPDRAWKEPFAAVHRDGEGAVTGLVAYRVDDNWDGSYPNCTLTLASFLALDLPTAVALWRLVLSVDWVRKVVVDNLSPDNPLPLLLKDPRGATPHEDNCDFTWLRVLDVEKAFSARTYGAPGRIVLEVEDDLGYAAGRWAIEVGEGGVGRCARTVDEADLALGAGELGSIYLGSETLSRLAAAALVKELRPGAAAAADLLLRAPLAAWTPDVF
ncbi:GNAT family N-acetyltransferase [Streptomyces sp. NRRL WC-3742]|uniref:GNAT family N-acetyltransferase n=1 Tax=Streptomyces sp. NRRL WC-3742 TaxID=1463934 RepID=UPI00069163B9|nr:GNAT family N-acetyltransferase [Streptomyces sp. NRRL WC-3742]